MIYWATMLLAFGVPAVSGKAEEVVTPEFFNRIEVVLALHQQAQVGLHNVAVGDAAHTYREFAVNASADAQAFHVLPHQRQSSIGGEVVGQFFLLPRRPSWSTQAPSRDQSKLVVLIVSVFVALGIS